MSELGRATDKASMGEISTPGQTEQMESMSEAVEGLSRQLGEELPEASRNAATAMQSDSSQIESDQRKIGGGFNFIRDAMEKLDTIASQNKLQTFIQAISLSKLNDIAGSLGDIGTQGTNLTTGLEGEMQSLSKSARATGANFGYTGKELKKFSSKAASMAKGLAIDANTAALALRGWDEAGSELAAMGFKNAKQVAKFADAYGVSADVLRNSGLRMRKEFKMGDKEISQVTGSFAKMGQITGDVTGAMNEMPKMMDLLRRRAASMGQSLNPKELADYAGSMAGLAAGFMQSGQSSDQARSSAMALTEEMIKSKEGFQDMFGGVGADLSDFNKDIAIAFGDVGVSFESMSKGPDEFVAGMAEMVQKAKKNGDLTTQQTNIMSAHLRKAFGDDRAAELVNFFKSADQATLDLMKTVKKTPAALGKMADEGFQSSKTLADRFEEAEQRMVMSFRSIGKAGARDFVSDSNKQFKTFGKTLKTLAAKGGLMGAFVTKMSEAHQLGVKAFLPKTLRPMAALMGNVVSQMTPIAGALGAMGLRMKHLANPFLLTAVAAGGMFALFKTNEKNILSQNKTYQSQEKSLGRLKKQLDRRKEGGKAWMATAEKIKTTEASLSAMRVVAAKEAKAKTIAQVEEGVREAIKKISIVGSILVAEMKKWLPAVQEFLGEFWHTMIYGVDPNGGGSSFASEMGAKLGGAVRMAAELAYTFVVNYLSQWWDTVLTIWSDDSTTFTDKLKATFESSAGIIIGAFAIAKFTPVFGILGKLIFTLGVPLVKAVGKAALSILKTLIPALFRMVTGIFTTVVPALVAFATTLFTTTIPAIVAWARKMTVTAIGALVKMGAAIFMTVLPALGAMAVAFVTTAIPAIISFGVALAAALWPFTLIAAAVAAVVFLAYTIYDNWGSIKEWFLDTFGGVIDALTVVWKPIGKILMAPIDLLKGAWNFISTVFTDPVKAFKDAWSGIVDWFGGLFDDLIAIPKKAWKEAKAFGSALGDFASGDYKGASAGSNEEQALQAMATHLKRHSNMSEEAIKAEIVRMDKSNALKKVKSYDIARALALTENDSQKALALIKDTAAFADAKRVQNLAYEAALAAQEKAKLEIESAKTVTSAIALEAGLQTDAQLAATDNLKKGLDEKTTEMVENAKEKTAGLFSMFGIDLSSIEAKAKELFGKLKEKAAEARADAEPVKALIVNARGMRKIGPMAEKSFKRAGRAVDGFGENIGRRFDKKGKNNISVIADKAFTRIEKRALQFRDVMRDIWSQILDMTKIAMAALQQDSLSVANKLNAIARAAHNVSQQTDDTSSAPAPVKTFRAGQAKDEAMLNATHWPDWYTQDFKKIATAMRDSLRVRDVVGGSSSSVSGDAKNAIRRVARRRVGGNRTNKTGTGDGGTY
jgi:hypothetical protein